MNVDPECPPFNYLLDLRICCAAARKALDPGPLLTTRTDRHWNRCAITCIDLFDQAACGFAALSRGSKSFPSDCAHEMVNDLEVPSNECYRPGVAMMFTWRLTNVTVRAYAAYYKLYVLVGGQTLSLRVDTSTLPAIGSFAGRSSLMETLHSARKEGAVPVFPVPLALKGGLCYLPPSRGYTMTRLRSHPEELATLAYVMVQAHVVAILHAASPRWKGALCVSGNCLPQVWERVVESGMFRWPLTMWLESGQDPTTCY